SMPKSRRAVPSISPEESGSGHVLWRGRPGGPDFPRLGRCGFEGTIRTIRSDGEASDARSSGHTVRNVERPMSGDDGGSVTCWLANLKEGALAAAQPLWERYFSRLVAVARGKLKRVRRTSAGEDEEDAALSAFNSFCGGIARGRFPQLADRDDLWKLLVV